MRALEARASATIELPSRGALRSREVNRPTSEQANTFVDALARAAEAASGVAPTSSSQVARIPGQPGGDGASVDFDSLVVQLAESLQEETPIELAEADVQALVEIVVALSALGEAETSDLESQDVEMQVGAIGEAQETDWVAEAPAVESADGGVDEALAVASGSELVPEAGLRQAAPPPQATPMLALVEAPVPVASPPAIPTLSFNNAVSQSSAVLEAMTHDADGTRAVVQLEHERLGAIRIELIVRGKVVEVYGATLNNAAAAVLAASESTLRDRLRAQGFELSTLRATSRRRMMSTKTGTRTTRSTRKES